MVIYAVVLPLAIVLGWMTVDLANLDQTSFGFLAALLFMLSLPLLLKWHYPAMLLSWNTAMTLIFLPGKPALWVLMAGLNFGIVVFQRVIQKQPIFLPARSMVMAIFALLVVVLVTAKIQGGFGSRAAGSAIYGGKRYYYILAAIIGYFALISHSIPTPKAKLYIGLFFLGGIVPGLSNLIYLAGPSFYFLYFIFPVDYAGFQALTEYSGEIVRVAGLSATAIAIANYLFATNGIAGVFRKWRLLLVLSIAVVLGMFSGFRSLLLLLGCIFGCLFLLERLHRSSFFPVLLLSGALGLVALIPLADKLPASVQRTLSFLPLQVDARVRRDAQDSWEWRLQMWKALLPELPQYFWLGKGYAINPTDLYLTNEAARRHQIASYEGASVAGDYHSGPLSVYIPFGAFGCLAFIALVIVSARVLYANYHYGPAELRTINRFLFAYFCGRILFFFGVFGALAFDLQHFLGAVGLSIALNKGVCRKPMVEQRSPFPVSRQIRPIRASTV